jgi:hypothetical protein
MNKINSLIEVKLDDVKRIGIVLASEWVVSSLKMQLIRPTDFVVCEWSDYHDGVNSHIEGMTTIAVCRYRVDADLLFNIRTTANNICYVVRDTEKNVFLTSGDFFTENIKNARIFSDETTARHTMDYYIKIYSKTNRILTTQNLEVIPIGMQFVKIIKQ